jgi:CheY-like chemotaxis protein
MVLAAVDDIMFASKITTTARQLGVEVVFVKRADAWKSAAPASPSLVILDLNSRRLDPLGAVAAIKADPAFSGVPTIGFVSHVQGELVAAARRAGVDEVLARSAFVERLPEILARDRRS